MARKKASARTLGFRAHRGVPRPLRLAGAGAPVTASVLLHFADGTVGHMAIVVTEFDGQGRPRANYELTEQLVAQQIQKTVFDAEKMPVRDWRFVARGDLPEDRTFRDAWRHTAAGAVKIDMTAAREIHRGHLREARGPMLAQLDVDYQRADEAKDEKRKSAIATEKQRLRDVTDDPAIAKAKTPDALKAVWPLEARG